MDWKHGYFAETGYTYGFYAETAPARLAWIAVLKGYQPALGNFRYLDLGCGQGLSLIHMAALHPDSEFVGVDFMPEHVAHGRQLASAAGLSNVRFIEADFVELAKDSEKLGEFDYVVSHGITSWIAPEVRDGLFSFASRALKPGGLMYNSYNTYPGWLAVAPFQHLVSQLQTRYGGRQALEIAQQNMAKQKEAGSALFSLLPSLQGRLEGMADQDPAYLVQEYNNQHWQPVYSSQMLQIARKYKLEFVASATLPEVFEGCLPPPLAELINSETDAILRETIRDLVTAQSFRRDIYIKGGVQFWQGDRSKALSECRFITTDIPASKDPDAPYEFQGGSFSLKGKSEVYEPIVEAFGAQGNSLLEALKAAKAQSLGGFLQNVALLVHGGWLALEGPGESQESAKRLNRATAQAILVGAPYRFICCPRIRSSVSIGDIDFMIIGLLQDDVKDRDLKDRLVKRMQELGKRFVHEGKPIADAKESEVKAIELVGGFLNLRQANLVRLGAI